MPGTVLHALYTLAHSILLTSPKGVTIVSVLQMADGRPRKVNYLLKLHHSLAEVGIQACVSLNLEPTVTLLFTFQTYHN